MIMGKAKRLLRPANLVDEVPDDEVKPDLTKFLGSQIRSLRRARDVTLDELSKRTDLSTGNLSQIERSLSSPSIKALHTISRALGVNIIRRSAPGPRRGKGLHRACRPTAQARLRHGDHRQPSVTQP
jgi:transcriptional regulator with XRE-family HTH domain